VGIDHTLKFIIFTKNSLDIEEKKKLIEDLFDKLEAKNLVEYKHRSEFPEKVKHIQNNRKEDTKTVRDFNEIFDDPEKFKKLTDFIKDEFDIEEKSTRRLITNYSIFHGFNYMEAMKSFLIQILKQGEKIGKRPYKISEDITFTQLAISLSQELDLPSFEELFPQQLRRILGHGNWFFKKGKLCYDDEDGEEVLLDKNEFFDILNDFDKTLSLILDEYLRRLAKSKRK